MRILVLNKGFMTGLLIFVILTSPVFQVSSFTSENGIDVNLDYSTYFGNDKRIYSIDLILDNENNIVIAGYEARGGNLATSGVYNVTSSTADLNLFVAKFSHDAKTLIFSTYIGGYDSLGHSEEFPIPLVTLAIDSSNDIVVLASSDGVFFPTANGLNATNNGGVDAVLIKLSSDGTQLLYSTFIGGTQDEFATDLMLDSEDNIYISGYTTSEDFPTTSDSYNSTFSGLTDLFMLKMSKAGDQILFSTFLGGSGKETRPEFSLDDENNMYIVGMTESDDFPTTPNAYDTDYNGEAFLWPYVIGDGFISKLSSDGKSLVFSTYFGGFSSDSISDIALDSQGNIVIVGFTNSINLNTTVNAIQPNLASNQPTNNETDIFISKLTPNGSVLLYLSYFGGSGFDFPIKLTLDNQDNMFFTGRSFSSGYPVTIDAYEKDNCDGGGVWSLLSPKGEKLLYSTYFCGDQIDTLNTAVLHQDKLFIAGTSRSRNFPVTSDAYQDELANTTSLLYLENAIISIFSLDYEESTTEPTLSSSNTISMATTEDSPLATTNLASFVFVLISIGTINLFRKSRKI